MEDKFTRGYLSGAAAGVVMAAINLAAFNLGFSKDRYIDMIAMLFWNDMPKSIWEMGFAQVIHLGVNALFGVAFAYLLPKLGNRYLLFKGSTYGAATWFLIHSAGAFFHIPAITETNPVTVFSHLIAATMYGLLLVVVLIWFQNRVEAREGSGEISQVEMSPAFKPFKGRQK